MDKLNGRIFEFMSKLVGGREVGVNFIVRDPPPLLGPLGHGLTGVQSVPEEGPGVGGGQVVSPVLEHVGGVLGEGSRHPVLARILEVEGTTVPISV